MCRRLLRPDIFSSVVLMSADRRYGERCPTGDRRWRSSTRSSRHWSRRTSTTSGYYSSRANADMKGSRQGLHAFLRGCYLNTSAGTGPATQPTGCAGWTATELAKLPTYYAS